VGKTRLALEAAARLQTDGARSVWFVSLADLSDPTYLAQAIADGLCLPHVPQVDPLEQIITALTAQPAVLILDNFEHLVTDGAALVTTLLTRAPQLQILVTSRKLLGLLAELEFALAPMPVPEPCNTPERLIRYESVQLFLDRAQAVRPNFCMNPNNTADIGALCERLEGLPLAIELAAARTVVLAPAQMLKQLEDRFKLLAGGRQDLPERQRTLRATLDWSYSLLGVGLRTFFARLSVFRGSWTLEAAEKVCAEPLALDLLAELRACSLIQTLESDRQIRFRMLETVREFAALYLPVEERDRWQQQHLDYFLAFAEEAARQEGQPPHDARDDDAPAAPIDQTASIETASIETASIETASIETTSIETTSIEQEQENLRAALARAAPAEAEKQVRLANALFPYWRRRGHYREGRRWLEPAEAEGLPLTARTRAASLHNAGTLALLQGDDATAERLLERCLALHRTLGEAAGEAAALMNLGDLALRADQPERAEACFRSSLELRRQREDWIGVADVLVWLGNLAQRRGNLAEAQHLYGESLVFYQRGNVSAPCALVLNNLGVLAYEQEQYEAALACYDRCLEYYGLTGDRAERARTLNNRGNALRALGRVAEAEAVLVESLTLWHELENPAEAALTNNTLGLTHCARGDHVAARRCLMASWLFYQRRMDREGLAYTLTGLAEVALGEGRPIKALRLLVQAQRERADLHCVLPPGDQRDWDRALLGVLAALPESEFLAIWHGDNPLLPARQPSIAP
jgi:predicted ATPase